MTKSAYFFGGYSRENSPEVSGRKNLKKSFAGNLGSGETPCISPSPPCIMESNFGLAYGFAKRKDIQKCAPTFSIT